jgi:mevalonate kinase|tara:strand:- start:42 stop:413 length:372 start_codon:yes stop_codon:yes gene_type:complete
MSLDNTLNRYDPHKIAEAKMEAIIDYRKCKRAFNQLARIKEEKEKGRYLHYRFLSNEKHSVEDAKAKAKTDKEVTEVVSKLEQAEQLMDESFAELDRITTKIELMADANATARAEMKLGGLTP